MNSWALNLLRRSSSTNHPTGTGPAGKDQMKARIQITLKTGVLDPQGKAIQNALGALGFAGVEDVRQGKFIEIELAEADEEAARTQVDKMCKDLLTNMVIENYSFELVSA